MHATRRVAHRARMRTLEGKATTTREQAHTRGLACGQTKARGVVLEGRGTARPASSMGCRVRTASMCVTSSAAAVAQLSSAADDASTADTGRRRYSAGRALRSRAYQRCRRCRSSGVAAC